MMNCRTVIAAVTACALSLAATAALACDIGAVKTNIAWLKTNNMAQHSEILRGCRILNNTNESGMGLQLVVDSYKKGEAHDPAAAAAIDGCTAVQILTQLCN
jgi:hypothetical protein